MPPLHLLEAERTRRARNKIAAFYPETGPLRRELYAKHMAFFAAGAEYRERLCIAANRVGKTVGIGAYETTLHLTGNYPEWWVGKRFDQPVDCWAAGDTSKTVRDIIQHTLCGPLQGGYGTGMIPGDLLVHRTAKQGLADALDTIYVRHRSGGTSVLGFKSYDQRRESFQGTAKDLIWLDEEPPQAIDTECGMRLMTTRGHKLLTFTPLMGWTGVVDGFLNEELRTAAKRWYVNATWDDVPHLSQEQKEEEWAKCPPHQRDARSKGTPSLGAGAIYPVPESDFVVPVGSLTIPKHWPRAYGMDVGWNRTAAIWGAHDRETSTVYLYDEYYRGHEEPTVNAEVIKSKGSWIPGVIDPASRGRSQVDGSQLLQMYIERGLDVQTALNAVERGIYEVWTLLSAGKLKVFANCINWLAEFRKYRRDEKGAVVKENDHLMDATRYLILSGRDRMIAKPAPQEIDRSHLRPTSWMD